MRENDRIIGFYSGAEPDHRGRYLHEMQQWPDDWLEGVHDYIQWLFPLPEPSGFNVAAPVLDHETMKEFRTRPELRQNLRVSFLRMAEFYGLEVRLAEPIQVTRKRDFAIRAPLWLSPCNHNHLRITRILKCLSILGLKAEAEAFFERLSAIYEEEQNNTLPAISDETFEYWRSGINAR